MGFKNIDFSWSILCNGEGKTIVFMPTLFVPGNKSRYFGKCIIKENIFSSSLGSSDLKNRKIDTLQLINQV